ncbi:Zinc finger CCCH-type [Pyrenophora seminiperda CCB06]|uniref:Zinc finger CCCH-type n=1 Tax=Pyrenophora seminiperda CCB06 TaxID=1302712 RepID=A0A3M7MJB7_9PLEO|nr:Zinc finger CCCH-type [Pyrenophora seminiperda CCB06]
MATQTSGTCALPEGLRYYLLRQNDVRGSVIIPLVPVDQLPFSLQGVPRELTHRQMSDQGWKFFSETNEAPTLLSAEAPRTTTSPRYLAPDYHVRAVPQPVVVGKTRIDPLLHPNKGREIVPESLHDSGMAVSNHPSFLVDKLASIYPKDAQRLGYHVSNPSGTESDPFKKEFTKPWPSGIEPDSSKKEYCTHWIRTGECSFTAVGCKFKHDMPAIEKLHGLGFRSIPQWWKEKSAIGARSPTWMQRRLAGSNDTDRVSETRDFPDPATFRTTKPKERISTLRSEDAKQQQQQSPSILKRIDSGLSPPLPPAPMSAPVRRDSQMSDLLIDLGNTPAPPPSPQLSLTSTTSNSSSEADFLLDGSTLPHELDTKHALRIDRRSTEQDEQKQKVKQCPPMPISHRRCTSLSMYDPTPTTTDLTTKPSTLAQQHPNTPRAPTTPAPSKPSGLAASKYCVAPEQTLRPKANRGKHSKLKGGKCDKPTVAT